VSTRALPKTAAEFAAYTETLDSPEKIGASLADGTFAENVSAYVSAQNAERADMAAQVEQATQSALVDFFRDNGKDIGKAKGVNAALLAGATAKPFGKPANAPGAALNGKFEDVTEYVNTIFHQRTDASLDGKLALLNEYSVKVPDAGGFLVPEEFRQELLRLSLEASVVKPRARVIPMAGASLTFPTVDATSNVSSVYGGIVVYRKGEGEEFVESQAKFGRVKLDPTKQTALAIVNNELIRDGAGAFNAFLNEALPEAMAFQEDVDYMSATGVGEPLGALNAANPGLIVVAKETGQNANTLVWENVLRMYARMLPGSIGRAVWLASPDTFFEIATMALSVGTGGSAVWLMDAHGAPQLTLLGRPVVMTEKTPGVLGQQGDLSLVDFGFYLIGQRDAMTMDTSPHVRFTRDQTVIRVIQRNDGRPWLASPITPKNGGATLSPFVTLAVRA
jgi:HK97 family phage major capsid protein